MRVGVLLAEQGKLAEAVAHLHLAVCEQPRNAQATTWAYLLAGLGRRDETIAAYRRCLAGRPDHFAALNNLGLCLEEASPPAKALILLRQLARVQPDAPEARNHQGLALADLGRFAEAEAAYRVSA